MTETLDSPEMPPRPLDVEALSRLPVRGVELYRAPNGELAPECVEAVLDHLAAGAACLVVGRRGCRALDRDRTKLSASELRSHVQALVRRLGANVWSHAVRWTGRNPNTAPSLRPALHNHYGCGYLLLPGRLARGADAETADQESDALSHLIGTGLDDLASAYRDHRLAHDADAWVLLGAERVRTRDDGTTEACYAIVAMPPGGPIPTPVPWVVDASDDSGVTVEPPRRLDGGAFALTFRDIRADATEDLAGAWGQMVPLAIGALVDRIASEHPNAGHRAPVVVVLEAAPGSPSVATEVLLQTLQGLQRSLARAEWRRILIRTVESLHADEHPHLHSPVALAERVLSDHPADRAELAGLQTEGLVHAYRRHAESLAQVYGAWSAWSAGDRVKFLHFVMDHCSERTIADYGRAIERLTTRCVSKLSARDWTALWPRLVDALQHAPRKADATRFILSPVSLAAIRRLVNTGADADSVATIINLRTYAANQQGDLETARQLEALWASTFKPRFAPSQSATNLQRAYRANARINSFEYDGALALLRSFTPHA